MAGKDLRDGGLASLTIEDILAPGFSSPWDAPPVADGRSWRADFTLVEGRVVHDYLGSKGG
jgi:hypothetical protein